MPLGDVNNRVSLLLSIIKTYISNLVRTTRFCGKFHRVHSSQRLESQIKLMDLNKIENVGDGHLCSRVTVMVFNATFNKISVISWLSALLVETASH